MAPVLAFLQQQGNRTTTATSTYVLERRGGEQELPGVVKGWNTVEKTVPRRHGTYRTAQPSPALPSPSRLPYATNASRRMARSRSVSDRGRVGTKGNQAHCRRRRSNTIQYNTMLLRCVADGLSRPEMEHRHEASRPKHQSRCVSRYGTRTAPCSGIRINEAIRGAFRRKPSMKRRFYNHRNRSARHTGNA